MISYISLVSGMLLLPAIYALLMLWYRPDFKKEENQKKRPFSSMEERAVLLTGEIAFVRFWYLHGSGGFTDLTFVLVFLMLAGMTFFCMADIREQVVPNKVLLVFLFLFVIAAGLQGLANMDRLLETLPSVALGVIFCALCFGAGYVLSRKAMGAGDVKLSLVMGLYLTGEYVVGAIVYGCLAGAAYSIIQLLRKKVTRKDSIPFVPFLYTGLIIRLLVG